MDRTEGFLLVGDSVMDCGELTTFVAPHGMHLGPWAFNAPLAPGRRYLGRAVTLNRPEWSSVCRRWYPTLRWSQRAVRRFLERAAADGSGSDGRQS